MGSFMKFRAEQLFNGTELLDGQNRVLVMNGNGVVRDVVKKEDAGDEVLELEGILCPGFINTHCHLELSHMKGKIAPGIGMLDFLLGVMNTRKAEEEVKLQAMNNAEKEMWQNGIVAVGDICNTQDSFPVKKSSDLAYYNFIEVSGFVPATAENRLDDALYTQAQGFDLPFESSVSPHAPYSVSPELFELIFSLQQNVVTIHNQESAAENEFYISGSGPLLKIYEQLGIDLSFFTATGKSSLQSVAHHFKNTGSLLLVHNCFTNAADIEVLKQYIENGLASFCICANANEYIGNPLPDLNLLLQSGMNICLGTDSLASNNQLNIWHEVQTIRKHYPAISLETLLQWATANGARALNMEEKLGSFEKGKTPGVLLLKGEGVERLL